MGRRVRCQFEVDDSEAFLRTAKDFFLEQGYDIERDDLPTLLILTAGNAAWTVVGTHRWSKTSRTLIASSDLELPGANVELLYDVSWLAIQYRPQGEISKEVDELLEYTGHPEVEYDLQYESEM